MFQLLKLDKNYKDTKDSIKEIESKAILYFFEQKMDEVIDFIF